MNNPSRPVTELDKSDVLDGLFSAWHAVETLGNGLSEAQWRAPTALPDWSVHDVVAHLVGVESMLQGLDTPDADIDLATLKHVRNDIGVLNERWVRRLRSVDAGDLLDQFREVTAQRRDVLSQMSDHDWNALTATPAGPDSYGRFMRVRIFDCWMHEQDIRDAVDQPATQLVGPPSRLALDEMTAAMGRVVGKLGGAPDGSRVRIELTGPLARTVNVSVDERARVVADFGGAAPTATIELDGLLFTRLCGGRTMLAQHPDAVAYGGDETVGRKVVEHLNYVI